MRAAVRTTPRIGRHYRGFSRKLERPERRHQRCLSTVSSAPRKKVVLGMSGGVDSSVAAMILTRDPAYHVVGVYMKNWDAQEETTQSKCMEEEDMRYIDSVSKKLGVEIQHVNFVKEYWHKVFEPSIRDFAKGITPNPDILCNKEIKFKAFIQWAKERLGADIVATGHYARVGKPSTPGGPHRLLKAVDEEKDQTYFLATIDHSVLPDVLFPVGELTKSKVRKIAEEAQLSNAHRRSSAGICFIGRRSFPKFLSEYIQPAPGLIRCIDTNRVVGRHEGVSLWTIGQRARIGGEEHPWFVCGKDVEKMELFACQEPVGKQHPALYTTSFKLHAFHWIGGRPPEDFAAPFDFRVRHRQPLQQCILKVESDGGEYRVEASPAQRAITPGQVFVAYRGEECLGGGIIALEEKQPE